MSRGIPALDVSRETAHPAPMTRLILPLALAVLTAVLPAGADPVIRFQGEARMGVTHDGGAADRTAPYGLFRLDTHGFTTTDNGLRIGAQVRMQADPGRAGQLNAPRFYVSTGRTPPPPTRY